MQVDPTGDGLSEAGVPLLLPGTWSPANSADLYRIPKWGPPYFSVNSSGNIYVRIHRNTSRGHHEIDLLEVVKKATQQLKDGLGLQLPIIFRFPDLLKHRLESLQSAFDSVIRNLGYRSFYKGVYPVKCNQDAFIVNEIVEFGAPFHFGLEAGSKPELLLAMSSLCKGSPDALLICNGFKDEEYIELAIIARNLKLNSIIVLELEEELDYVINLYQKYDVRPVIGVRAKLHVRHNGHFGSTSGENGKFGLTGDQIDRIVEKLRSEDMLDCLELLHFHMGSQIPSTKLVADAVSEGAKIYCHLVRSGANMGIIDVGGGLGVDYGGSKSTSGSDSSIDYTLEEYARAVVSTVQAVCNTENVEHPIICSESGRAIVSHHSVLIFEAFSAATDSVYSINAVKDCMPSYTPAAISACFQSIRDLIIGRSWRSIRTYHINLSIFTSIPDYWGIEQRFPIVPIHRLEQKPTVEGILSDLTCDSDGLITKFIGGDTLLLHDNVDSITENGKYYLGMFLGGAYQEALGGHHNLFGGPNIVGVEPGAGPNDFTLTLRKSGSSSRDVLRVMQHNPDAMLQTLVSRAENLGHLSPDSVNRLRSSFDNMPYLVMVSRMR